MPWVEKGRLALAYVRLDQLAQVAALADLYKRATNNEFTVSLRQVEEFMKGRFTETILAPAFRFIDR